MLPRPTIITRRALVTGAAAVALAPRELRAANAAGWNASDKNSGITISSLQPSLGANQVFTDDTNGANYQSVRTVASITSGKWIIYFSTRALAAAAANDGAGFGVTNGSASLSQYAGQNTNSYGVIGAGMYTNAGLTYNLGNGLVKNSGTLGAICINADASPKRIHYNRANNNGPSSTPLGWVNWSGTASDPTNNSSGTDISALGTPLYIMGSAIFATFSPSCFINLGGWPPPTDIIAIPSGYSMLDANYPYTIPVGNYTIPTLTNPSGTTLSHGNMRLTTTSGAGTNSTAYSSNFPTNSKTIHSWYWDNVCADATIRAWTGLHVPGNASANQPRWNRDGTTTNLGGVTWAPFFSGDTTYIAYNAGIQRLWGYLNGTWYGSGGSPDPFTNTNGVDVSGITNISDARPGSTINSDFRQAFTFNAGALTDTTLTLSGGWTWLENWGVTSARPKGRIWH